MLSPLHSCQSWVWHMPNLRLNVGRPMGTNLTIPPVLLHLVGNHPLRYQVAHQDSAQVRKQLDTWTHLLRALEWLVLYQALPATPTLPSDPSIGYQSCNFSRIRTKTSQRPASEALLLICPRDRLQRRCPFAHGRAQR